MNKRIKKKKGLLKPKRKNKFIDTEYFINLINKIYKIFFNTY